MDKYIKYYYNINPFDIHIYDDNYFFSDNAGNLFCLFNYSNSRLMNCDVNHLFRAYEISTFLHNNKMYCHSIIITLNSQLYIKINNSVYVLLKYDKEYGRNKKISVNDLKYYFNVVVPPYMFSNNLMQTWSERWSKKLDYFEYQLNQFGFEHPYLRKSFGYFSGMVELAISIENTVNSKYYLNDLSISHFRIAKDESIFDFYNPLNFIIDLRERDFSEYCKNKLFTQNNLNIELLVEEALLFMNNNSFDNNNIILFFIRILYFTEYFDAFEDIMNGKLEEKNILSILSKITNFEKFLNNIYFYIKKCGYIFPHIEWLEKNIHNK